MENNFKITKEIIEIIPKTKHLSPTDLTRLRNIEISPATAGLKRTLPENTPEVHDELEKLYDQLQKQLSKPRIERLAGRALGEWDPLVNAVRVVRKDGKFGNFGYSVDGQLYLEYYEAMFLLEVNRLQLEYNSKTMSIEQAYLLLMGEQNSGKYQEYLVYSNLTRVGYILVKHQNIHFQKHNITSEADCVWAILEAELHDEIVPEYVRKTKYYANTKQKFDNIKNVIKNPTEIDNGETTSTSHSHKQLNFANKIKPNLKRAHEEAGKPVQNNWHTAKRRCNYATAIFQHSLVDFLKDEDEYKKFKDTFEKFDIIPLKINETETETENEAFTGTPLTINFDVYLHNEGFRKSSPHLPNFRVIILKPDEKFPTHDEIFFTHRQQLNPVPLLIVSINDSKQLQAFLYYFS